MENLQKERILARNGKYLKIKEDDNGYRSSPHKAIAGAKLRPLPGTLPEYRKKHVLTQVNDKKKIIGICGSASRNSGNLSILKFIAESEKSDFDFEIIDDLTEFPHFRTDLTDSNTPDKIVDFRNKIFNADGIIICTPEYVFSIPSGLKNIIEWCVSTTVFSDKPSGLITASASGEKGHEELKLVMETVQTAFTDGTTLLIQGLKNKVSREGKVTDENTIVELRNFIQAFKELTKAGR